MNTPQPAIFAALPPAARVLSLDFAADAEPSPILEALSVDPWPDHLLIGVGAPLLSRFGAWIPGYAGQLDLKGAHLAVPWTPSPLWLRISGDDPGQVHLRSRQLLRRLPGLRVVDELDLFVYSSGRDLTGYEDGTENPTGEAANQAALLDASLPQLQGSSIAFLQRWQHDLSAFEVMSPSEQDACIGRRRSDNVELTDAPPHAHVKRTAQESFEPPAFVLRRSQPWRDHRGAGLHFLAFASSVSPFERQFRRMLGLEDGIRDALFRFSRPQTGATYWCPGLRDGRLDLRILGI
jgi:putative iron-dependent peroxidase